MLFRITQGMCLTILLFCTPALAQSVNMDEIIFFFTNEYGRCAYGTASMDISGSGLCAYDSTINRVYMCDQDYAGAIG